MLEEYKFAMCPTEILEDSIHSCWGTLKKQAFEKERAWQNPNNPWNCSSMQAWMSQGYSSGFPVGAGTESRI